MKRNRFLILALWLALALATGLTAAPAAQAASCYGSGCAGQDPQSTGCSSGAANVSGTEYWASSFSRAMRNSGTCSARWARLVIDDYLPTCCYAISTAIESQRYYAGNWIAGDWRSRRVGAGLEGSFWTPMIANLSDDRARVCHRLEAMDGSWYGTWNCSGWVS
ncbi:DUF2690 domain-containing protein [Lentzea sp. HUAS12]|uniref:DUF2690 domain-containing protein n=1 Tax=Lentzea sp. HUAS12 TaxID=2951806 RepID=UPI0020A192F7|nr:DUF2690 domain-containing protein [Lentzea sp. HUAS12]USX53825.1 YjfA family protein [Lentzea sp. HUAS12]